MRDPSTPIQTDEVYHLEAILNLDVSEFPTEEFFNTIIAVLRGSRIASLNEASFSWGLNIWRESDGARWRDDHWEDGAGEPVT